MNDHIIGAIIFLGSLTAIATWTIRRVVHWASEEADRRVEAELDAANLDLPTTRCGWLDECTEDWLFVAPEFIDNRTPIADSIDFEFWAAEIGDAS